MKFSIIVPIYNRCKLVPICIRKMLEAKQINYEIILVDDGSTDNTLLECKKLASKYPNVYAYHQENKGVSAARNYGLEKAKGDYVLFVDSDDIIIPEAFPFIEQMTKNNVDMIMFRYGNLNAEDIDKPIQDFPFANQPLKLEGNKNIANWIFTTLNPYDVPYYSVCGKVFNKKFLDDNKLRFKEDVSLGEDQIFICDTLCHINTFTYSERQYYYLVSWPNSMRPTGLGSYHRSMDDYLHNQVANYDGLIRLYSSTDLPSVKKYAVNYIVDRPITRILFRNVNRQIKNRSNYYELAQFCKSRILPILKLESANQDLLKDKQIAFIAKMTLNDYPFWLIYTYCFIEENLIKTPMLILNKIKWKISNLLCKDDFH